MRQAVGMRLLVLGGTQFVGRALVNEGLTRGWDVSALHRGVTGSLPPGVRVLTADRRSPDALAAALGDQSWDLVVDTWSGAPTVVGTAVDALAGRVSRYGYVSTVSVYERGRHVNEQSPLVPGDPTLDEGDYATVKRGAELAVLRHFPDAVFARPGLIIGPYEDLGRLPWWLARVARGGRVVAPGRPDRPLQYVDARDLADWMLTALAGTVSGGVDVISPSGFCTTEQLLDACCTVTGSNAEFVWIGDADLAAAGALGWTQLPCWVPESGYWAGFMEVDTSLAAETGLRPRPIAETVQDTWDWMQRDGFPPQRADTAVHGLPTEIEQRLLAAFG